MLEQNIDYINLPGMEYVLHSLHELTIPFLGGGDTNRQRACHTDEIRDSVDVEIIVCDTARI
jgi:hypothetical protein